MQGLITIIRQYTACKDENNPGWHYFHLLLKIETWQADTSLYKRVFSTESLWCKNQNNHNSQSEQREIKRGTNENSKKLTSEPPKTQENASVQVAISLFWFLLVGKLVRVFWNNKKRSKAKSKKSRITLDPQLKSSLINLFFSKLILRAGKLTLAANLQVCNSWEGKGIGDWFLGVLDKRESLLSLRICSELLPILEMKIA